MVVHARGREATLYSARAGVDLIFHAYDLDDECLDAMVKSGCAIGPTMTFPRNIIDFTQPYEPAATKGRIESSAGSTRSPAPTCSGRARPACR